MNPLIDNLSLAAALVTVTAMILLVSRDWRVSILILAGQYVGVFLLVASSWPRLIASIVLISGWVASAVLAMATISVEEISPRPGPIYQPSGSKYRSTVSRFISLINERAFYIVAALLILLVIGSQMSHFTTNFPGIPLQHAWSGLALIGLGLLLTGFSARPLQITLGIMTWMSGFEILYASVQSSLLMAGLLAMTTLALSLSGAYFQLAGQMEGQD